MPKPTKMLRKKMFCVRQWARQPRQIHSKQIHYKQNTQQTNTPQRFIRPLPPPPTADLCRHHSSQHPGASRMLVRPLGLPFLAAYRFACPHNKFFMLGGMARDVATCRGEPQTQNGKEALEVPAKRTKRVRWTEVWWLAVNDKGMPKARDCLPSEQPHRYHPGPIFAIT